MIVQYAMAGSIFSRLNVYIRPCKISLLEFFVLFTLFRFRNNNNNDDDDCIFLPQQNLQIWLLRNGKGENVSE